MRYLAFPTRTKNGSGVSYGAPWDLYALDVQRVRSSRNNTTHREKTVGADPFLKLVDGEGGAVELAPLHQSGHEYHRLRKWVVDRALLNVDNTCIVSEEEAHRLLEENRATPPSPPA